MSTLPIPADASNFQAWCAAQSAIRDVKDLIAGSGPFNLITVEERSQALQEIIGALEGCDPLLFPRLKKLDDQCIIGIVSADSTPAPLLLFEATAELCRRVAAPTPDERDEIEQRIAADEQQQPDQFEVA